MRSLTHPVLVVSLTCASASAFAQSAVPARFEVASIKQNTAVSTNGLLGPQPGGRVNATNMALRQIISFAYQVTGPRLVGGPAWLATDRFDIVAKLEGDGTLPPAPTAMQEAMRALLEERFQLKTHHEQRELDVYALEQARSDGRVSPALKKSSQDCSPEGMKAHAPQPGDATVYCGIRMSNGNVVVGGMPMSQMLGFLTGMTSRVVVDRTGLEGGWDFEFSFTPTRPGVDPPTDPNAPSIFTALQEQLGLKLESTKAPVDVLVIDSVEHLRED